MRGNLSCASTLFLTELVLLLLIFTAGSSNFRAQTPEFNVLKPSTTGVPGEEVRIMTFDPSGNLWVATRWIFWHEYSIAMLPADQAGYEPLPGGGFDTGAWKVWSNVHYPLPSDLMIDMAFTPDGSVWVSSEAGLTRFRPDAASPAEMWHTYTPNNSPLQYVGTTSLAVDGQGNLWVVNGNPLQYGGLYKLNPMSGQWTQVPIQASGGPAHLPRSIAWKNGMLLASLEGTNGFAKFDGATWTFVGGGANLAKILQDNQGNVWGTANAQGLWRWNGTAWQNWSTIGGTAEMTSLGLDRNGVVFVGTWFGAVYKMIGDTPALFADAGALPTSVIARSNGDIWINNYGGNGMLGTVRHYDEAGQLLERFNGYNAGLQDYFIDRILSDSQGNLWFATGEGGLSRMLGSDGSPSFATKWRNWGNHNVQSEPYPWTGNEPMYSVMEDSAGIFWFGGNGVGRWDSNTGQFTNFWNWQNSNIDTAGVNAIVKRNGKIWVGMGGSGVLVLENNVWRRVDLGSVTGNNVRDLAVDSAGNLWVASEFGLRKFEAGNDTTFTLYHNENSPLPNINIQSLEADPADGIWIGTSNGLVRFNGATWTTYNQANTGMPGNVIYDIARRRSDGLLAIANNSPEVFPYTGGVSTFDGNTWQHYTPDNSPLTHWQVKAVEFDRDGDLWASALSQGVVEILIGGSGVRAPFDFDGDGKTDIGIVRNASSKEWWVYRSSGSQVFAATFGAVSDIATPADFTGDGKTDVAVFRPANGFWYVLRSEDLTFYAFPFGANGDVPAPGDFDGDGKADAAVFRPSNSTWYQFLSGGGSPAIAFGAAGDKPVVSDYDGDGKSDIAIFRPNGSSGSAEWWMQRSTAGLFAVAFGSSTDKAVPGDYTGDGKADVAFWRPSSGEWYVLRSENLSFYAFPWGGSGDIPAPGDYDGDGKHDAAVFRPTEATWYINRTTGTPLITAFGANGDRPVPNAYVP